MPRTFVWHPSKGPAKSPKLAIGHSATMGLTLAAIGLKHHQHSIVQQDSPSLRGQLKKVRHLVSVTPVEGEG
jgi:large subunit ribosomal protein L30